MHLATKFLILFTVIVFTSSLSLADGLNDFCQNKWENNYRMIEYCLNEQIKAQHKVFNYGRKHGLVKNDRLSISNSEDPYQKIIYNCMNKWELSEYNTYNYRMVDYCIKKQVQAYERLK